MTLSMASSTVQEKNPLDDLSIPNPYSDNLMPEAVRRAQANEQKAQEDDAVGQSSKEQEIDTADKQEKVQEDRILTGDETYILPAGTVYSAESGGGGPTGTVDKNIEVGIYSRVIKATNPITGAQVDIYQTDLGDTWEQFAEKEGMTIEQLEDLMRNNPNCKEYICLMEKDKPLDIQHTFGWNEPEELIEKGKDKNEVKHVLSDEQVKDIQDQVDQSRIGDGEER